MPEVEVRCPVGPQRLFMKLLLSDDENEKPRTIPELNLMELACSDCARFQRKNNQDVFRVLHRYDITGCLAENVIQYNDGTDVIESAWQ
jgi:hypothetical protein